MQSANERLESAPAHVALRQSMWSAWGAVACTLATVPLIPSAPLIHIGLLPVAGLAATLITRKYHRLQREFANLGKKRGFTFTDNRTPRRADAKGRPLSPDWTWKAGWLPFRMVKTAETYASGPTTVWRKTIVSSPAMDKLLAAQSAWLMRYAKPRFGVVEAWWTTWYVTPLLERRLGPGAKPSRAQQEAAAAAMHADLMIGLCIAGQEPLWARSSLASNWEKIAYRDLTQRLLALPDKGLTDAKASPPPPFPLLEHPGYKDIFLGRGFMVDQRHTERLEDLKLRNLEEVTDDPEEQGDPRIYGIGHNDVRDIFTDEAQLNQMAGIFGSNGVGKTRFGQALLDQVIRNGHPLVIIDPKSDDDLLNHVVELCRELGRYHSFRYFSLAAPTSSSTWSHLCQYNPCSDYNDPAELAARIAALVPATKDPFWSNTAKGMCETCMTLCHWACWFLCYLGRDEEGRMAPKGSRTVPRILLAMQWARHHLDASPEEADAAITDIARRMSEGGWTPSQDDERDVVALMTTRSMAKIPIYCPNEWVPSVRHVSEYMIDGTLGFLGWVLRIVFPHLYLASNRVAQPDFPRIATDKEIISKAAGNEETPSMWAAYLSSTTHPLELRYEENLTIPNNMRRWQRFYDHFVPQRPGDDYLLSRFFESFKKRVFEHATECFKERKEFINHASTLNSAIKPFLGEIGRLMCAVDSDLSWKQVVDEKQVVYCGLASMVNPMAAISAAKLLAEDFTASIGRRYQYSTDRTPIWLFADEISSFITDGFLNLLNKGRGAGLHGIIAGQTQADLNKALGNDGAQIAQGNLNTFIQLRTMLHQDAEAFSKRPGDAAVVVRTNRGMSMTPAVGNAGHQEIKAFNTNENHSFSRKDVRRIPPSALLNLPRGQAFIHLKGLTYLVHQGLFAKPRCSYGEEVGYIPGVLADDPPHFSGITSGRGPAKPMVTITPVRRPKTAGKTPSQAVPGLPEPVLASSAPKPAADRGSATFRRGTDAGALGDDALAEAPGSDPWRRPSPGAARAEGEGGDVPQAEDQDQDADPRRYDIDAPDSPAVL